MNIIVLITTYERPSELLNLLKQIKLNSGIHNIIPEIHNDASTSDYSAVDKFLSENFRHYKHIRHKQNHGKQKYWKLINHAYSDLRKQEFDYLIQLPDDISLVPDFFNKAIDYWEDISDFKKICLNLLLDESRRCKKSWTKYRIQSLKLQRHHIYLTGWIDLCFISTKKYLQALSYQVNEVPANWFSKMKSSGVGRQLSLRLYKDYSLYQVTESLVIHDDHESKMNYHIRKINPLITKVPIEISGDKNRIYAGVASIADRVDALKDTVNSIINQIDLLFVYLNNYKTVPVFLNNPKIVVYHKKGDLGDAGKFYNIQNIKGYYFSLDDDLVYPKDYVKTYIERIEKYQRKAIITSHGRRFTSLKIDSYYRTLNKIVYRCLGTIESDRPVHVGGTGVMAFHTDTFNLNISEFKAPNMADIWISLKCQKENIPIICISHPKGWIIESQNYSRLKAIANTERFNDTLQTNLCNSITWKLLTIKNPITMKQIIIPWINPNKDFQELRYALRSIEKHLKEEEYQVVIIGEKPDFISDKVLHIPHERAKLNHFPNCHDATDKMSKILLSDLIADEFVITYDDIYFLKDITFDDLKSKVYKMKQKAVATSKYGILLKQTFAALATKKMSQINFETHLPRLIDKNKMLAIYQEFKPKANRLLHFTLYHNYFKPENEPVEINHSENHVKAGFYGFYEEDFGYGNDLSKSKLNSIISKSLFLNHNDDGLTDNLRSIIEKRFSEKSIFEL